MNEDRSNLSDRIWERVRRVIFDVIHAVLGPPPPDVTRKVEDVLRTANQDWEEREKCQDETDETQ